MYIGKISMDYYVKVSLVLLVQSMAINRLWLTFKLTVKAKTNNAMIGSVITASGKASATATHNQCG